KGSTLRQRPLLKCILCHNRRFVVWSYKKALGDSIHMLLHTVYTVMTPANKVPDLVLPLTISLDANTKASLVEQESGMQLHIDRKIDHTRLELENESSYYKKLSDGKEEPVPTLRLV